MLLPHDAADDRNAILEVRAGTGGDEAALFAGDLVRIPQTRGPRLEAHLGGHDRHGGRLQGSCDSAGRGRCLWLKFERGVHRVQRVPATERRKGAHERRHVAVLPVAREVDVALNLNDVRKDTRAVEQAVST